MKHQLLISTALTAVLAVGFSTPSFADAKDKEKCFGISKAAQMISNLSGTHSCAGTAKLTTT